MEELQIGKIGTAEWIVTEDMTAEKCGSGLLPVFSTPMLVALMEAAACDTLSGSLPEDSSSVGMEINVQHLAPSAVGAAVRAESLLTGIEGRILSFEISVYDGDTIVGKAAHKRAIIKVGRFMDKLKSRQ